MSNSSAPGESKDISMVDVSNALPDVSSGDNQSQDTFTAPPIRRKSTLILTDEDHMKLEEPLTNTSNTDADTMHIDRSQTNLNQGPAQSSPPPASSQSQQSPPPPPAQATAEADLTVTVPVEIKWSQGGEKVYVTGSFTGWRKMIGLARQPDNNFLITLGLPVGTHRFRFVIDNELRFSDYLPTATDQMGNFVNYVEVTPENVQSYLDQQAHADLSDEDKSELESQLTDEETSVGDVQPPTSLSRKSSISRSATRSDSMWGLTNDDDDMGNGYSRYHDEDIDANLHKTYQFINDIPPIFVDPKVMEQYYMAIEKQSKAQNGQQAWLHPPQLPPHLENVILNNFNSMDRDNNSGALPIPNHVVLNHLATTSIKHNTLSVASIVRYKRKYVTQVLYAPLQQ
ncbi:galactose metabolism- protein [Yamadazyma tenuis]|uniref:AMPKBI-domain-containing protein n=1 Tax=Candida tenuis (strain ATCC 10573 / BCRC 21748 / CBS 615 / JCM 9827 / NBRC 10315 / NRRL Y-1498 / VKM Y-70) TaxID=590646 RepID=G3BD21_CANTC|nr:AMPKBI-domain-containing protein [Yamadazyma tenuis ATCC 10573]EGV60899.1 AMPKBI-domain-containing protein [Yamadazyma tenuis ATCC 10573]WEJ93832.1 galactose metabolism- protein [Yamadazyma tenuis]